MSQKDLLTANVNTLLSSVKQQLGALKVGGINVGDLPECTSRAIEGCNALEKKPQGCARPETLRAESVRPTVSMFMK